MRDLFEHQEELPQEVQKIIASFNRADNTYENCEILDKNLKRVGYTCDYGLDASPYNLRKCKSERDMAIDQIRLQEKVQKLANVNIVTCGNCGTVLLHEMNEDDIECFNCRRVMEQSDCPDFWYEGVQDNLPIKEIEL